MLSSTATGITDHGVKIILPVVERSVTIAGISTRELVSKDFATDPNEERMRKAGHLMAQKLGVYHYSVGEGEDRYAVVTRVDPDRVSRSFRMLFIIRAPSLFVF